MKKPVQIREYLDDDTQEVRLGIVVAGELFDWAIGSRGETERRLYEKMSDPSVVRAIKGETIRKFLEHFSEFLGFKVNLKQVNEALKQGWIEVPNGMVHD